MIVERFLRWTTYTGSAVGPRIPAAVGRRRESGSRRDSSAIGGGHHHFEPCSGRIGWCGNRKCGRVRIRISRRGERAVRCSPCPAPPGRHCDGSREEDRSLRKAHVEERGGVRECGRTFHEVRIVPNAVYRAIRAVWS